MTRNEFDGVVNATIKLFILIGLSLAALMWAIILIWEFGSEKPMGIWWPVAVGAVSTAFGYVAGLFMGRKAKREALQAALDYYSAATYPMKGGADNCDACPTATDGGCTDPHDDDCKYGQAQKRLTDMLKAERMIEPE